MSLKGEVGLNKSIRHIKHACLVWATAFLQANFVAYLNENWKAKRDSTWLESELNAVVYLSTDVDKVSFSLATSLSFTNLTRLGCIVNDNSEGDLFVVFIWSAVVAESSVPVASSSVAGQIVLIRVCCGQRVEGDQAMTGSMHSSVGPLAPHFLNKYWAETYKANRQGMRESD